MRTIFKAFTAFVMLGALAGMAQADEGDNYSFVLGSIVDPDTAFDQESDLGFTVGIGREANEAINVEGYLRLTNSDGLTTINNSAIGFDLQLVFMRGLTFEPYAFLGMNAQRSHLSGLSTENGTAQNFGIGFRANPFNSDRASLRGEYRYIAYDAHKLSLDDQIYSIGVQYTFGRKSAPPVVAAAPPPPAPKPAPRDSDGDGVIDDNDKCPGTVRGAAVDATGCELDSDNDGVVNRLDKCPNTRAGAQVDVNGCEIKEEIQLQGVTFETNSDRLVGGTESVLNEAAATLIKNPSIKVEVAGHTDSDGAAEYNESLSARRAATVRDYLAARGVEISRMTMRGYGESQPVADNATREGKAANRRVVLRITAR
jgi:OOP family OmpA-OmpF porin